MAVRYPAFRKKFPLLVTGGLLALQPFASHSLHAAEQYDCQASSSGGWACAPKPSDAALPARPQHSAATISSSAPANASTEQTASTSAPGKQSSPVLVTQTKGRALTSRSADFSHLDWVPREKLTAAQLAEAGPYCAGAYIEPRRPGMNDATPLEDAPTFVSAKASRFQQEEQIATLAGDVVVRQSGMQVEADEASLYQAENRGELVGNVRLRDRGMLVVGDRGELQLDNGEAKIENAEYVLHQSHVRGSALYAKREETAIIRLKDGTYTRCEPGENDWHLKGNNVTLNPATGFGTATNVTLRVKNIPVFYTPYIYFPIDDRRQSGFLPPSISTSSDAGLTLVTPYYFNIAPNYDATLYPHLMTERGLLMEGEFRYLTKSSEGQVGAAYLDDQDDERKGEPKYEDKRYMVNWQHTGGLDSRLLTEVDFTDLSDPYYFQDLETDLDVSNQTYVNQRGTLTWRGETYTARLNAHAYELATVTDVTPYNRMPQLTLDGYLPFRPAGLQFTYNTEYVDFERNLDEYFYAGLWSPDARLRGLTRTEGQRLHLEPGVSLPLDWSWGYVKPTIKYLYTDYDLDLDQRGRATLGAGERFKSSQDRGIPLFSLDSGLYFDRDTSLFGKALRQTLEPRAYYLNVAYRDQSDIPVFDTGENTFSYSSLWRENRFSGKDRIGDENRLSLGVTSRFVEANGFERARVAIGQAYHFEDRRVQLPGIDEKEEASISPIAMLGQYRFDRDWRLSSTLNWDPDRGETSSGSVMFHFQPEAEPGKVVNAGYRYRNDTRRFNPLLGRFEYGGDEYKIDQSDFSVIWPIVPQWSAIARWQFDFHQSRTLEAFGGFEYDNCCWKLRLINRYWVEYDEFSLIRDESADRGIFLQIVLKGLGSVTGSKVDSFLDDGIQGYREREDQAF
ncbi:LPS-assembly protein LptD [Pseudomonas mangrovi]|uniref:LPS-assembly protein LptD n=1 Tax=Pseudomonas mangrovi TaxID=2161748 RepID=A0A2T5PB53_9PSED|nr:LPS-assembly protein LptD [Pseudomonas mangrovi]PTU74939.1 LPS biosynthesis protein [Pseudomonas mangrovi]